MTLVVSQGALSLKVWDPHVEVAAANTSAK